MSPEDTIRARSVARSCILSGARMARRVPRIRSLAAPVCVASCLALGGCDDAHFDAEAYELTFTNTALAVLKPGQPLHEAERWIYEFDDYGPRFCTTKTTTPGPGAETVSIDWHGCTSVPGTDFVGTFEYVGDGIYEGLVDVTTEAAATGGTPVTFTVLMQLEPR